MSGAPANLGPPPPPSATEPPATRAAPAREPIATTDPSIPSPQAPPRQTAGGGTCRSATFVVEGMCAPTAISRGLAKHQIVQTPTQVQLAVTGSGDPRAWLPAHFVTAARVFKVALVVSRRGFATQTIAVGPTDTTYSMPRIFLTVTETHVEPTPDRWVSHDAIGLSRNSDQYVDVGSDSDGWKNGGLKVLQHVRAASGDGAGSGDGSDAAAGAARRVMHHQSARRCRACGRKDCYWCTDGYCGAQAFYRLTGVHPARIQRAACGHRRPAPWGYPELFRAARFLNFAAIQVHRRGHAPVRCVLADVGPVGIHNVRLGRTAILYVDADGTHVTSLRRRHQRPDDDLLPALVHEPAEARDGGWEEPPGALQGLQMMSARHDGEAAPGAQDPTALMGEWCESCGARGATGGRCVRCAARQDSRIPAETGEFGKPFVRLPTGTLYTRAGNGLPYTPIATRLDGPPCDLVQAMSWEQLRHFTKLAHEPPYNFICPDLRDAIEWERGRQRGRSLDRQSTLLDADHSDHAVRERHVRGTAGDVEDLPRARRRRGRAPVRRLPLRRSRADRDDTHDPDGDVFHGLCAATAISRQLGGGRGVAMIQREVKGSPAPAAWTGDDFIRAAEVLDIDLTVTRVGFAPVIISRAESRPRFQVVVHITADGRHARSARPTRAASTYHVGTGASLPGILGGVAANSGHFDPDSEADDPGAVSPPDDPCSASDSGSASSNPPDDDGQLAKYAEIYDLVVSSPASPRAAVGWMKRTEYHLLRYHDAIPTAGAEGPPRLRTQTDRWRLSLCAIGAKAEYMLLQARSRTLGLGSHWATSLGGALAEIRPMLPPSDDGAFRSWDPEPLLARLRVAASEPKRAARDAGPQTACALADAGRIAAARAALKGIEQLPRPPPSVHLRDALERLHPEPHAGTAPAASEDEFTAAADKIARAVAALPASRRVTAESLHHSALRMRGATAPGPDGWSGDMVRRAARLFKNTMTALLERYFLALRDTRDPLLAQVLLDAVMLAFLKPGPASPDATAPAPNRFRPISVAGAFARCILAKATTLSRKLLRDMLDPLGQYALTGTAQPVAELMATMATCARGGIPYVLTRADIVNAFGSAGQQALLRAICRVADVAPELAALSLRAQCSTREGGYVEIVLRGEYDSGAERLSVRRWARGGAQGPPDMPAAFAMVMAMVDEEAARRAGNSMPDDTETAAVELWALFRRMAADLPNAPDAAWLDALTVLLAAPRSPACVTTLYADDAHSAGHFYAAIRRTLWRVICGRECGLTEAPLKCGLLTAPRWRPLLEVLIAPLRNGNPAAWPLMDSMKVLGVTFTDPGDLARMQATVAHSLAETVTAPIDRLTREVDAGERKGTALFLLHRYTLPVLAYHQSAWGLLAPTEVWCDVDRALNAFCAALCPEDLRDGLCRGTLRRELALPRGEGGLGIPSAAAEAHLRAAALWPRRQALAAGAPQDLVAAAYRRESGPLSQGKWKPVSVGSHHKAVAGHLLTSSPPAVKRRLEQNSLRGGTRAFAVVPWREELAIDNIEFDVAWRLAFGGMTPDMVDRIDHPVRGFRWRGERMEWAFAQALHDCLPPGSVVTGEQPAPERLPIATAPLESADRADVDVLTRTGKRFTFDVRTVNVQRGSAHSTAAAQCAAIEAQKRRHYDQYYRHFHPFVITLSGAVSTASAEALLRVTREVAKGDRSALDWEPARWTDDVLQRLAIESVKTVSVLATRAVLPPPRPTPQRANHVSRHVFCAMPKVVNCDVPRGSGRVAPRASRPGLRDSGRCVLTCHKV